MRRRWHPYTAWEDYLAGMYGATDRGPAERAASIDLLYNAPELRDAMAEAVMAWPIAAEHNLTDTGSNRRAWLGQSACCHSHGSGQLATCSAWWALSDDQRDAANASADLVIAEWERTVVYGAETLFAG